MTLGTGSLSFSPLASLVSAHRWLIVWIVCWGVLVIAGLGEYLHSSPHLLMGLIAFPCTFRGMERGHTTGRWLWASLFCVGLSFAGGPTVCMHMAAGCVLLGLVESHLGRLSAYAPAVWAMLSPATDAALAFTFEWRLILSQWVGAAFRALGASVQVEGTGFVVNGQAFQVEAACLGLSSFHTGILLMLTLLAMQPRRWHVSHLLIWASTLLLLLISNLFRIGLIVFFQAPPGTLLHEVFGLLSLLVYVIGPVAWMIRKWASPTHSIVGGEMDKYLVMSVLSLVFLAFGLYQHRLNPAGIQRPVPLLHAPGFTQTVVNEGILKLERPGVLIYLKPGVAPWRSEHSPATCWRGSGYSIRQHARYRLTNGLEVNAGTLEKHNTSLYTLWWFANGVSATASPAEWRRRTLNGEPSFWLVNVTAPTREEAECAAEALVEMNGGVLVGR